MPSLSRRDFVSFIVQFPLLSMFLEKNPKNAKSKTTSMWFLEVWSTSAVKSDALQYGLTTEAFEVTDSEYGYETVLKLTGFKEDVERFNVTYYGKTLGGRRYRLYLTRSDRRAQSRIPFAFVIITEKELESMSSSLISEDSISTVGISPNESQVLFEFVGSSSEELMELLERQLGVKWISRSQILIVHRQI